MVLIGIAGQKGVGKDTVADFLVAHYGFHKHAFADPIKEAVVTLFQLDPMQMLGDNKEKIDPRHNLSPRQMMQIVGTDMFRNMVSQDFWTNHFKRWYLERESDNIVVSDVRFQNEVDTIRALGGRVIRIKRHVESAGEIRHTLQDSHPSETGVAALTGMSKTLVNDGSIEDLHQKVIEVMD